MNDLERRKFRLHADTDDYHRRIEQAADWTHYAFRVFENPCLNYSGGKDSLVLLHLTTQRCGYDDVDIYHFDNGLLSVPGAGDFVRESVDRLGGRLFERTSAAANSAEMVIENGHGYNGFWGHYHDLAERHNWDARLLGIRAAESPQRRDRFDTDGTAPINWDEERTAVAPIHQLTTRDVWAYIIDQGLEYHEIYDEQGALYDSMEHPSNRLVTLYDREFKSTGSLELSQFLFPSETNGLKQMEQDHDD